MEYLINEHELHSIIIKSKQYARVQSDLKNASKKIESALGNVGASMSGDDKIELEEMIKKLDAFSRKFGGTSLLQIMQDKFRNHTK